MSTINWGTWSSSGTLHPTYGNFGGEGYSAGEFGGDPTSIGAPEPVNQLDAVWKQHDINVHTSATAGDFYASDRALLDDLNALKNDPNSHWNDGTLDPIDKAYARRAEAEFRSKVKSYEDDNNIPPEHGWPNSPGDPGDPGAPGGFPPPDPGAPGGGGSGQPGDPAAPGSPDPSPPWAPPGGSPFDDPPASPLIIDMDGDGIELVSLENSKTYFDLDQDGFTERTGWTNGDDAFLAFDRNGNGRIDDISELFGNATTDGFTELSVLDSNSDGVIDNLDLDFGNLLLWKDADSDGYSDTGELTSLTDAGLQLIDLGATQVSETNQGHIVSHRSTVTWTDSSTNTIEDIWFQNNQMLSEFILPDDFSADLDSFFLPNLHGYGNTIHLFYALSLDASLKTTVVNLVGLAEDNNLTEFHQAFEQFAWQWAGVQAVDPSYGGDFIDGRHLAFLEALHGQSFFDLHGFNPGNRQGEALEGLYVNALDSMAARFLVQTPVGSAYLSQGTTAPEDHSLSDLLTIEFDFQTDQLIGDTTGLINDAVAKIAADSDTLVDQTLLLRLFKHDFEDATGSYAQAISNALGTAGVAQHVIQQVLDILADDAILYGTDLSDVIESYNLTNMVLNELLFGGLGNDTLRGGIGDDDYVYRAGDGDDIIDENGFSSPSDTDRLLLGSGLNTSNIVITRSTINADNITLTFAGIAGSILLDEQVRSLSGIYGLEEIVFGDGVVWSARDLEVAYLAQESTDGDDTITAFIGDDVVEGGLGNDTLYGAAGGDTLEGGLGNDTLIGESGGDTYIYTLGDGDDTISDDGLLSGVDRLVIHGITPATVTLTRSVTDTDDLTLSFAGGGSILLDEQFHKSGSHTIEEIAFDDSTVWSDNDIKVMLLAQASTGGDDTILGFAGADILEGGLGNDTITGGRGGDTYIYNAGDGDDTISDNGLLSAVDRLIIHGIAPADVTLTRSQIDADDVTLSFAGGGSIVLDEQSRQFGGYTIEEVEFDNGTIWTSSDIENFVTEITGDPNTIYGTAGNDTLVGTSADETFEGLGGDDTLRGSTGSDTYRYASGDGSDLIDEASGAATDRLLFTNLNASDLTFSTRLSNKNDLEITVNATGEVISSDDQFYTGNTDYGIEEVVFANGTVWDAATIQANAWFRGTAAGEIINGSASYDDTIVGNGGDDTLKGSTGSDTYRYASGDGNDLIDEAGGAGTDRLVFTDLNASDLTFSTRLSNKNDLEIAVNATGEVISSDDQFYTGNTNYGFEEVEFADGTVWDAATIQANAWYRGTAAGEIINGSASYDDTIVGNGGDDTLKGSTGSDTYRYASGDGNDLIDEASGAGTDRLVFTDLNASDLTFSTRLSNKNDLEIAVNATGEVISSDDQFYTGNTNYGFEEVEFADGTVWDAATIQANAWFRGTTGNDTITGTSRDDSLFGDAGDDTLSGSSGNDTFIFKTNSGNDVINGFVAGATSDDVIELQGMVNFDTYAEVTAAATQVGADTEIDLGADGGITLAGIDISALHEDDFRFV